MSKRFTSEELYRAGARIARSGGREMRRVAVWCGYNRLTSRQRGKVMEGFHEESAQILMFGIAARHGRPYGRI